MTIHNSLPPTNAALVFGLWICVCIVPIISFFSVKSKEYLLAVLGVFMGFGALIGVIAWQYRDYFQDKELLFFFIGNIPIYFMWFAYTITFIYGLVGCYYKLPGYPYSGSKNKAQKIFAWIFVIIFELISVLYFLDIDIFDYFKSTEKTSNEIIIEQQVNQDNVIDFKEIIEKNKFNSQTSKSADFRRKSCDFPMS